MLILATMGNVSYTRDRPCFDGKTSSLLYSIKVHGCTQNIHTAFRQAMELNRL